MADTYKCMECGRLGTARDWHPYIVCMLVRAGVGKPVEYLRATMPLLAEHFGYAEIPKPIITPTRPEPEKGQVWRERTRAHAKRTVVVDEVDLHFVWTWTLTDNGGQKVETARRNRVRRAIWHKSWAPADPSLPAREATDGR